MPQRGSNFRAGGGISIEALATVAERVDVSARWLLLGDGPRHASAGADVESQFRSGTEAVMTPVTYQIVGFLKRAEQEDYYDLGTDFNPFKLET